ncbi:MAG: histidinol-phosphate transaminase [Candidatus Baltobacteraceae bacterium]
MNTYAPGESMEQLQRRYGQGAIVKLNANENPLGTSPKARMALRALEDLNLYGDDTYAVVRERLGERLGVPAQQIVLGHGSNELIALAASVFLKAGDRAVMGIPSFSLFRVGARAQQAEAVEVPLRDGVHDIDAMLAAVDKDTKMIFICDPNNPTGTALQAAPWEALLAGLPSSVALVVDQAYFEYMDRPHIDARKVIEQHPRTLILRTASKIYGLASLRFGYGFGDSKTIADMNARRVPYNVSKAAVVAALAALDDEDFVQSSLATNASGKIFLSTELQGLGLDVLPSETNFLSVGVPVEATRACEELLQRGIAVRSGDGLSMPGRLRITIGTQAQNRALLAALAQLLQGWRS